MFSGKPLGGLAFGRSAAHGHLLEYSYTYTAAKITYMHNYTWEAYK